MESLAPESPAPTADLPARQLLALELERRKQRNPRYSLRAFARSLALEPSQLSKVLRGNQHLSPTKAKQVATLAFSSAEDREIFGLAVELEQPRLSPSYRAQLRSRLSAVRELTLVEMPLPRLEERTWAEFALTSLAELDGVRADAKAIAKRLSMSEESARKALDFALAAGWVEEENGRIRAPRVKRKFRYAKTTSDRPPRFLVEFQERAILASRHHDLKSVYLGGKTLRFDRAALPEFHLLTLDFFRQVTALAARSETKESLYHLSLSFFDLLEPVPTTSGNS